MNTATVIKPWYKLAGVEYSTDFNFFIEEQIVVASDDIKCSFFSRLNGNLFTKLKAVNCFGIEVKHSIAEECKKIHTKLLNGEFGQGEFID